MKHSYRNKTALRNLVLSGMCVSFFLFPLLFLSAKGPSSPDDSSLVLRKTIYGDIRPKTIAGSGKGLFFAQNNTYRRSVTVYNQEFHLLKTLVAEVSLEELGHDEYEGKQKGAPIAAAFSPDGKTAWISNYQMEGKGFEFPGKEDCLISNKYDPSFVFKVNAQSLEIISAIEVGCLPKFLKCTPNGKYLIVSNYCSGDLSILDTKSNEEVKRIKLGHNPGSIAVDPLSQKVYIALMDTEILLVVDLETLEIDGKIEVNSKVNEVCMHPSGEELFLSLNAEGKVAKLNTLTGTISTKVATGRAPRSMAVSQDGTMLYVVNYLSNTLSKIRTRDMKVLEEIKTHAKPIGITFDNEHRSVWVACYTGSIMVFEDTNLELGPAIVLDTPARKPVSSDDTPEWEETSTRELPQRPAIILSSAQMQQDTQDISYTDTNALAKPSESIARKAVSDPPTSKTSPPARSASSNFHIIVGSFSERKNADSNAEKLRNLGLLASVLPTTKGSYRVSGGSYPTRREAEIAAERLEKNFKLKTWLLKIHD